jgi:hypothetical protein
MRSPLSGYDNRGTRNILPAKGQNIGWVDDERGPTKAGPQAISD